MTPFRYERARDAESAVVLLTQAPNGVFLAGGTNLVFSQLPDLYVKLRDYNKQTNRPARTIVD